MPLCYDRCILVVAFFIWLSPSSKRAIVSACTRTTCAGDKLCILIADDVYLIPRVRHNRGTMSVDSPEAGATE